MLLNKPNTDDLRIKEIKAHTFGYGEPSGNTNYRLVITQLLEIAKFIELFIRPFQSEVPPSLRYKCCPQIYWSESLSTVNMCRANCQPECPHGIRVRRNAVLENRSASSLGASDA